MKFPIITTLLIFLSACHVIPKHYENDKVYVIDHKVYIRHSDKLNEEELKQVKKDYTEPYLDENEERALKGRMFGEAADLVTTAVGFSKGCMEANPIVGTNIYNVILVKGEVVFEGTSDALHTDPSVLEQHLGV